MTTSHAERDRRRKRPMWPVQEWADKNPASGLLFVGLAITFALAMAGLELLEALGPDYFFVALFVFLAARGSWTMWRQYQRIRHQ